MRMEIEFGLILRLAGEKAVVEGNAPPKLSGIASLSEAGEGDLSFGKSQVSRSGG